MAINLGFESLGIATNKQSDGNPVMNELEILHNLSMISIQMEHITADFSNIDIVLERAHHLCEINKAIKANKDDKSLEHLYGSAVMKAATEGFKESVSSAWEAIKKFFKELFEKIKNLFLSRETIAKNAIKKADDIVKNIKSKSIDKEKAAEITMPGIAPEYEEVNKEFLKTFDDANATIEELSGMLLGEVPIKEAKLEEYREMNKNGRENFNRAITMSKEAFAKKHDVNVGNYAGSNLFSNIEAAKASLMLILKEQEKAAKIIQKAGKDAKELKDQMQVSAAMILKETVKTYLGFLNIAFDNEITYLRRLTAIAEKVPTK